MRLYGKFVYPDSIRVHVLFMLNISSSDIFSTLVHGRFNKSVKNVKNDWKVYRYTEIRKHDEMQRQFCCIRRIVRTRSRHRYLLNV